MRKIFTLLAVCMLSIGAWAATYNYDCYIDNGAITIEDVSSSYPSKSYAFQVNITQKSYNRSDKKTYSGSSCIIIFPTSNSIEGTFTYDAGTMETTKSYGGNSSRQPKSGAAITFTKGANGFYTISGNMKVGGTSTWNYNFNDPSYDPSNPKNTFDPFANEPSSVSTLNFAGYSVSLVSASAATPIVIDVMDNSYAALELQFNVASELTAGTYNVATTGANGTVQAANGFLKGSYPCPSYFTSSTFDTYYLAGGSVAVSYNADADSIFFVGAVTTAHGSTINIDAKGKNPFYVPEPETVDLTVSQVSVTKGSGYFDLALTATPNNFMIDLSVSALAGASISDVDASYTYANFGSYDYSYMDDTKTSVNALSIVATGNTDEYKLNATIACENGNTYQMTDVVFEYETPNAWTEEPKNAEDFTVTATSGAEQFVSNKGYMLFTFSTSTYDEARIAIAATSEAAPAAGVHNVVNDSPAAGDVVGSAGKVGYTRNPSLVYMYTPNNWFFIRGGSVTIAYSQDNQKLMMTGDVTTYRGTTITLDLTMDNPFLPKEKTLDVQSINASITATGMDFDIVTTSQFDPSEVWISLVGTQANPLAIVGEFDFSKFDSQYSYAYTKAGYSYVASGSSVTITSAAEGYVMNGTLLCENGWTYFIEDAAFNYSMAVSDQASPVTKLTRAMDATVDLTVQRTLYCDGGWNTICLPFDWTITSDEANPLAGATVAKYVSASKVGEEFVLVFEPTTSLVAGQPYLIRWADGSDIESPVFKNVTIKAIEGATLKDGNASFIGILAPTAMSGQNMRFVTEGDMLSYAQEDGGSLGGFRAYFLIDGAPTAPARFVVRGLSTGLQQMGSSMEVPSKMMKNGQLIIYRDNKMFNAQGQQL